MRIFGFRNSDGEDLYFAKAAKAKEAAKAQAMDQEANVVVYAYETIKAPTSEIVAQCLNFGSTQDTAYGTWQLDKRVKLAVVTPRKPRAKPAEAPAAAKKGKAKGKPAAKAKPVRKAA